MQIEVTQERIAKGVRKSFRCCPLAVALQETVPQVVEAHVMPIDGAIVIYLCRDGRAEFRFVLRDLDLYLKIRSYDKGSEMTPFVCDLRLPSYF